MKAARFERASKGRGIRASHTAIQNHASSASDWLPAAATARAKAAAASPGWWALSACQPSAKALSAGLKDLRLGIEDAASAV